MQTSYIFLQFPFPHTMEVTPSNLLLLLLVQLSPYCPYNFSKNFYLFLQYRIVQRGEYFFRTTSPGGVCSL